MKIKKEQKQFLIFLGIGAVLGLLLSSFFFFLASYYKLVLNLIAILILALILFRSCWNRKKKCIETTFYKKIIFIIPRYFSVINLVLLLTVFIPNTLKTKNIVFLIISLFSFLLAVLFISGLIQKKQKDLKQNGENS